MLETKSDKEKNKEEVVFELQDPGKFPLVYLWRIRLHLRKAMALIQLEPGLRY